MVNKNADRIFTYLVNSKGDTGGQMDELQKALGEGYRITSYTPTVLPAESAAGRLFVTVVLTRDDQTSKLMLAGKR